jgi:hypothetical protein
MDSLFELWVDGGPILYFLVFVFFLAVVAELAQLAFARKLVFPRLFAGLVTAILAVSVIGTAFGYRLGLDVLFESGTGQGVQGAALKLTEVALTPILIGLGMVLVLVVLQMGVEARCSREVARTFAPGRGLRLLSAFAVFCLLVSGYLLFRAVVAVAGITASGSFDTTSAKAVSGYVTFSLSTGLVTVLLAFVVVVGSVIASALRNRQP